MDRLAERVGATPFFAYDRSHITSRVAEVRAAVPARLRLGYAVKANPMPAVVQHLAGLVDQNGDEFEVVNETFTSEPYGIGLELGDDEFRTFINDTLEAAYEDGSWAKAWEDTAGKVLETPEPPAVDRY